MIPSLHHRPGKKSLQDITFLCLFAPVACLLFWKCKYGIGHMDEAFYLTIPYRLLLGDALFVHEWHLSQMAGVLTMPFVSLWTQLHGGTDGLILSMRYTAIFVQCLISLYAYWRLRSFNWFGAVCASLCFALYIPFGIMALSYNSMGIMFVTLACLLLLPRNSMQKTSLFCSGFAYAAACLCCPYLAAIYPVAVFSLALFMLLHKRPKPSPSFPSISVLFQKALYVMPGVIVPALLFAAFVFSRASVQQILHAFSFILNDPEHPSVSFIAKAVSYVRSIVFATSISAFFYSILAFLFIVCLLDANRKLRKSTYFTAISACTLVLMLNHYFEFRYLNMVMWAINIPSVFILILTDKSENRLFFSTFWLPGVLYSFCIHLSSNQEFYAISSAASVAAIGSIMMLIGFFEEISGEHRHPAAKLLSQCGLILILGIQLFTEVKLRYSSVFWESSLHHQTVPIEQGIQAGLYVSEESAKNYTSALDDLKALERYDGGKVLFLSGNTWLYLTGNYEIASYSAWLSGVNEHSLMRLDAYYQLNPDKMPDIVCAETNHQSIALAFADRFDYQIHEDANCMILTK